MTKFFRIILPLFFLIFITGCDLGNTPTSKVEDLMSKYQMLDNDIRNGIDNVLDNSEMSVEQEDRYRKILEKQYKNLTYDVKEESIDGDVATIRTEIEVIDYRKVVDRVENEYIGSSEYGTSKYIDYKLDELEKAKERVVYTINFTCIKDEDGNWNLDNLTNLDMQKIQGMY